MTLTERQGEGWDLMMLMLGRTGEYGVEGRRRWCVRLRDRLSASWRGVLRRKAYLIMQRPDFATLGSALLSDNPFISNHHHSPSFAPTTPNFQDG